MNIYTIQTVTNASLSRSLISFITDIQGGIKACVFLGRLWGSGATRILVLHMGITLFNNSITTVYGIPLKTYLIKRESREPNILFS